MALPIKDGKITFPYGAKYTGANAKKGKHKGDDFAAKVGTPVYAVVSGVVNHAGTNGIGPTRGWGSAYGIQIIVNNDKFANGSAGLWAGYMHLSKVKVKRGEHVKKGQLIGYTGNTGSSTGPHLHLEIQKTRFWGGWLGSVNPKKWFDEFLVTEYVSWKAGDPAVKADPQVIKPKTWTSLKFGANGTTITPKHDGQAMWAVYVNIANTGGSSDVKLRFTRDPKGKADYTGIYSFDPSHEPNSHAWFFNAKKGQPVAVEIYHDGKSNLTVSTREFKMWIP